MTKEQSGLYAFYDPQSRRMKVANIAGSEICQSFFHQGQIYKEVGHWGEHDFIWSKSGKLIGFGLFMIDILPKSKKPGFAFRSPINARNAVVDGRRNDLNPDRNAFAEVCAVKCKTEVCFWWLTETWEDFVKQVEDLNWPIVESFPIWNGDPFVWEGIVNGKPDGDFILLLEFFGEDFGIDKIGFKLATENIPKCISDLQTFQNPSSRDSQTSTSSL